MWKRHGGFEERPVMSGEEIGSNEWSNGRPGADADEIRIKNLSAEGAKSSPAHF
ncbi:MAG: hypothetical protein V2A65_07585 [Candidatus Omnitrophota bacterium]